ncbi:hypothetical protein E2C01_018226 [Portunus trituberculatus]|uniref:Uncharacterized protein n=1 Tax=Portunus trituberculatus TaxID=210409 RepID=A0A5B7DW88_PORTR|nr:hypothetical protein [Portunus trituberculatus]
MIEGGGQGDDEKGVLSLRSVRDQQHPSPGPCSEHTIFTSFVLSYWAKPLCGRQEEVVHGNMEAAVGRGRGRGRGGVVGEGGELADLRRPHVPPDLPQPGPHLAREDAARPPNVQDSKCTKTFSLSAEAPEFVPRTFVQPQAPSQVHFPIPAQNMQHIQQVTNTMVPQPQMQYMCHPVVLQVNNLVVQLTLKPNRGCPVAMVSKNLENLQTTTKASPNIWQHSDGVFWGNTLKYLAPATPTAARGFPPPHYSLYHK